jgi:hypothetical protein
MIYGYDFHDVFYMFNCAQNSTWFVHVISMGTSWIFSIHVITYVYDLKINTSFCISQALKYKK